MQKKDHLEIIAGCSLSGQAGENGTSICTKQDLQIGLPELQGLVERGAPKFWTINKKTFFKEGKIALKNECD